ncbi:MAG: bacteriocin family protein [Acidobacteria bacterium]|nr:bacteriocin family protein [Acidobacteriota bacterium]
MYEATEMERVAMEREGATKMGYARPMEYGRTMPRMKNNREKLPWSQEIWSRIDQAVHNECQRTKVARKFLPLYGPVAAGQTTVHSDTVVVNVVVNGQVNGQSLGVDETETTPLAETSADIVLTAQQVDREEELMTAVTLATRAANLIAQAEDVLIFQGQEAVDPGPKQHPLFRDGKVRLLSGNARTGLLGGLPANQIIEVPPISEDPDPLRWGENTFEKVAEAYSLLQSGEGLAQAHYGPYALVLQFKQYADTYAPVLTNQAALANTLAITADRIKPLVTAGFYGTGTVPPLTGLLVSLGGNTMDLVVGMDVTTSFLQEDPDGRYRLRVWERFALRRKDSSAVIELKFLEQASP